MRRLLWIGDAGCDTGFARCTHKTLDVLRKYWDVSILGLNYRGDPHPDQLKYQMYSTRMAAGDFFGLKRIPELLQKVGPDIVVVQNDPWNIAAYLSALKNVPVVGALAVDGLNCRGVEMNGLRHAIFWTRFGMDQARRGGYTGPASVVPLGVDLEVYKPHTRADVRRAIPVRYRDAFIIGSVGRNQERKRLDLTLDYFASWVHSRKIGDAYLFMHVAPTGEDAIDVPQLATYLGIENRIMLSEPQVFHGLDESQMARLYSSFDIQISTTQGEGWGLTTAEGMACGVPQIVPEWAALGEWCGDAAVQVECTTFAATLRGVNAIGGIADKNQFIEAMDMLYHSQEQRETYRHRGLSRVQEPQYRWENIGERFAEQLEFAYSGVYKTSPQELDAAATV